MLSRARRGACEIVAGAALWRCRCLCRGRRCILCIWVWRCHCRSRGRRSILCIWVCVCVAGQAQHSVHLGVRLCGRGSIWQLSKRTAGAALWRCHCRSRGRRSILCVWVCLCGRGSILSLNRSHSYSHSLTLLGCLKGRLQGLCKCRAVST